MGGGQKIKILALGPNSTKLCIHNLWATRRLEMQKLGAGVGYTVQSGGGMGMWWNARARDGCEG